VKMTKNLHPNIFEIGMMELMNETLFIHHNPSRSPILRALRHMLKNEHLVV